MAMDLHVDARTTYFAIFGGLLLLTGVTVAVAYVDLGYLNIVVALGVAGTKATVVLLFFMHLRHAERMNWVVAGSGVFWLLVLITLLLSDYLSRPTISIG